MFIRTRELDGFIFYLGSDPFKSSISSKQSKQGGESGVRSASPQITKPVGSIANEAAGLSNITCELAKGQLVVRISGGDGNTEKYQLFSAILSNGDRHFIRVVRQNNLMTVSVNDTISINQDFPVAPTFIIEKLYLGNYPVESHQLSKDESSETNMEDVGNDIFGDEKVELEDESSQGALISEQNNPNINSAAANENNAVLSIESTEASTISSELSTSTTIRIVPNAESNIINENKRQDLSNLSSNKVKVDRKLNLGQPPQNVESPSTPSNNKQNELKIIQPRLLDEIEDDNSQINEKIKFSTAPLSSNPVPSVELVDVARPVRTTESLSEKAVSRERREISSSSIQKNKLFFKGIIQDVQISNGDKRTSRIVELFEQEFEEKTNLKMPQSVGPVTLHNIKKGEISDNTCQINPCQNNGTCQITWNDYRCECKDGWKGRNCKDKEYCFWNKCPGKSTCVSLLDGYECLTNATFNGISTSVSFKPENFPNSSYSAALSLTQNTIKVTFRSKYIKSGTILHIVGGGDYAAKYVRISIQGDLLSIEIPEGDTTVNKSLNGNVLSGSWQTVEVTFTTHEVLAAPNVKARLNDGEFEFITLESTIDFGHFVSTSKDIIIGSSIEIAGSNYNNQKDVYTSEGIEPAFESIQIHTDVNTDFFRGCIGQVRIGGVLLPFYEPSLLNETNFPNKRKFLTTQINDLVDTGCTLCYENECLNEGKCEDPDEVFECTCPAGFEDPLCETNIDECGLSNACKFGKCMDGVANYTCECEQGWEGWL